MIGGTLQGLYSGVAWLNSSITPSAGAWHHAALVRSGGTATLYLDGVAHTVTNSGVVPVAPTTTFTVGRYNNSGDYRWFAGDIDEVAVFTSALSGTTIEAIHDAGRVAAADNRLATRTAYDALGRATDTWDPDRVRTHVAYDRGFIGGLPERMGWVRHHPSLRSPRNATR